MQVAISSKTEAEEVEGGSILAQVDDLRFLQLRTWVRCVTKKERWRRISLRYRAALEGM